MGLISDFLGKSQAEAIANAGRKADAQLKQGFEGGIKDYQSAEGMFSPYAESGQKNQKLYDDLQGLNGPEAQAAAQKIYANDPYEQNALGQALQNNARYGNAMAWGRGKEALAGTRVANEKYGNWKSSYAGGAQQGLTATNAMAGYRAGQGDMRYGYGATQAGNTINQGNAMAASHGIGINNILEMGRIAASAVGGGMPKPK